MVNQGFGWVGKGLNDLDHTKCTQCDYVEELGPNKERVHKVCPKCGAMTRRV